MVGCRKGTPDFVCLITNKEGRITCLFLEAKAETAIPRKGVQQDFSLKYGLRHINMKYAIVRSPREVCKLIQEFGYDFVQEIEFP